MDISAIGPKGLYMVFCFFKPLPRRLLWLVGKGLKNDKLCVLKLELYYTMRL